MRWPATFWTSLPKRASPMADDPPGNDVHAQGMATRRATLGDAYVDRTKGNTVGFDERFQHLLTEAAWGRVWSNDTLSPRERSLVTLSILAARGQWEEFALHVSATRNTGATAEEVAEAMMHVGIYAGIPAANQAIKIAKRVLLADDGGAGDSDPQGDG